MSTLAACSPLTDGALQDVVQLFRFIAGITIVVGVSLVGISLEKRHLALTRAISLQQYRTDQLLERRAQLALRITRVTSPVNEAATTLRPATDHVSDPAAGNTAAAEFREAP